jgi:hypothetical protein
VTAVFSLIFFEARASAIDAVDRLLHRHMSAMNVGVTFLIEICAVHESLVVQVFGRRHDETIHALGRPASEKRQGTKSRWVKHGRCSGLYGDLAPT